MIARISILIFISLLSSNAYPDVLSKHYAAANIDGAEVRESQDGSSRIVAVLKNREQIEVIGDFTASVKECRTVKDLTVKVKKGAAINIKKGTAVKILQDRKDSISGIASVIGRSQTVEIEKRYVQYIFGYTKIKTAAGETGWIENNVIWNNDRAFILRGMNEYNDDTYMAMKLDAQAAIGLNPQSRDGYYLRGMALYDEEKYSEAIDDYLKALSIEEDNTIYAWTPELNFQICRSYTESGDYDKALTYCEKVLASDSVDKKNVYLQRGRIHQKMGKYQAALEDVTRCIEQDDGNAIYYLRRGSVYYDMKDYANTRKDYEKAYALEPQDEDVLDSMGMVSAAEGRLDAAEEFFTKALALTGGVYPMYNLACVHALKGNREKSIEWLKKAVAAGYNDWKYMQRDKDLDSLRDDAQFREIIKGR